MRGLDNQSMYLISVVVPIYNDSEYVERCCKQLLNQTLLPTEIILVDDGSTDDTPLLCDQMASSFDCIKALHQSNYGVSAARNAGLKAAKGEYVVFVDVDDQYESDMLEFECVLAKTYSADLVCLDFTALPSGDVRVLECPEDSVSLLLEAQISMSCCNKLFRRELIASGLFPEGTRIYEDLHALYEVLKQAKRVVCVNETKYRYIHREGSSSRVPVFTEKYFDAIEVVDYVFNDVSNKWPELSDRAKARQAASYLRISKIYWLRGSPSQFMPRIHELRSDLKTVPKDIVKRYFIKNDRIRLFLYLRCFPVFLLLIKTIDTN